MSLQINKGTLKGLTHNKGFYSVSYECSTTFGNGFGFKSNKVYDYPVGSEMILITDGNLIKGLEIAGDLIFYKSENDIEKEKRFAENVKKLDKAYNNLPDAFKRRIDKFRANNPNFRVEYEDYEMMCCEEAVRNTGIIPLTTNSERRNKNEVE